NTLFKKHELESYTRCTLSPRSLHTGPLVTPHIAGAGLDRQLPIPDQNIESKMHYPRTVAAHRLQTWLLVTALVAVFLTGMLAVDLARNLRSVVISEANKALANAVSELAQSARSWENTQKSSLERDSLDQELRRVSYEVLRSYPDIEGGYL